MSFSLVYIYNFFISFLLLIICKMRKIPQISYLYLTTLYYLIVLGKRWNAGVDFPGYFMYYVTGVKREYGYYLIQTFFYNNNIDFGVLIFVIYTFTTITSLWFFRKFSRSNLGIFLFFLSEYHIMSINPLRTYIAINLFLIGIYYWEIKDKRILGLTLIIFGVLFHELILGAFITYLFCKIINLLKYRKILNYILFIIPLINFKPFIVLITNIILPKYSNYFGGYFDKPLSTLNIVRYYIVLIVFLLLKKYLYIKVKKEKIILNGIYIYFIVIGIASHFGELHRVAYFFKIFEVIFYIYILDYKKINIKLRILVISMFLLNYLGIIYKDMGDLKYYEYRKIHLINIKSRQELFIELNRTLKIQGWIK